MADGRLWRRNWRERVNAAHRLAGDETQPGRSRDPSKDNGGQQKLNAAVPDQGDTGSPVLCYWEYCIQHRANEQPQHAYPMAASIVLTYASAPLYALNITGPWPLLPGC